MNEHKEYRLCLSIVDALLFLTIFWNFFNLLRLHCMSQKVYEASLALALASMLLNIIIWLIPNKKELPDKKEVKQDQE